MGDKELLEALCGWMGAGRLDSRYVLPVLQEVGKPQGPSLSSLELLKLLQSHPGPAFQNLAAHVSSMRRVEAYKCHQRKKAGESGYEAAFRDMIADLPLDVPAGWSTASAGLQSLQDALSMLSDHLFLATRKDKAPKLAARVEKQLLELLCKAAPNLDPIPWIVQLEAKPEAAELRETLGRLKEELQRANQDRIRAAEDFLAGKAARFPMDVEAETAIFLLDKRFSETPDAEERRKILDLAASWPTSRMARMIRRAGEDKALQERASLLMTLRFGELSILDWSGWSQWLARVEEQDRQLRSALADGAQGNPAELLLLWTYARPDLPAEFRQALEGWCLRNVPLPTQQDFLERYLQGSEAEEWRALAGHAPKGGEQPSGTPPSKPGKIVFPKAAPKPAPKHELPVGFMESSPKPPPPPEPPNPLWDEHVLPFLSENWTMLTGIAMVVAGSSLLAYYTWDKHWFIRYTVLPLLLGGFTALLARIGAWLEQRGKGFKATADPLRGAAVALLPANFMAVALMSRDPQVTHKAWLLPAVSALYLVLFGRSLSAWCSGVQPVLGGLLARPLLAINSLVLLGPLVQLHAPEGPSMWLLLGAGFHAGFLVMALTALRFMKEPPSDEPEAGPAAWFFGATLVSTYLQVFLWVHGFMRHLPQVHTYACMVVAAGGLVLLAESGVMSRRKGTEVYGKASFIGYALILLGLFMGASQETIRLATLELAGLIWLHQAVSQKDKLHAWIAFTLLLLGLGSVGTWDAFPGQRLPALALGLAALAGAAGSALKGWWEELEDVGVRMQAAILAVATVLSVLVQWHFRSEPLETGATLVLIAGLYGWRAGQDGNLAFVHTAMAVLAIALPYLGLADMTGRSFHGNTVVFGLSVLSLAWLGAIAASRSALLLEARSTVLFMYGALAVATMCLRVFFEQGRPGDAFAGQAALAFAGPVLMAACLLFAAYFSRSQLPALMAVAIVVILLPELKLALLARFPYIHWGSGFLSGVWALSFALIAFPLRRASFLKDMGQGDLFNRSVPFPMQRRDHTLFTAPVIGSAVYFALKVDTWNLARNWMGDGVHVKTALGLFLSGLAWTWIAVYFRKDKLPVHLGWMSCLAGLVFGYYDQAADPRWHTAALLGLGALNAAYLLYGAALKDEGLLDLLARPLREVLYAGSAAVSVMLMTSLFGGTDVRELAPVLLLTGAQLSWFALSGADRAFGTLLLFEVWTAYLAWAAPGTEALIVRLTPAAALQPILLFFLGIQGAHLLLEAAPAWQERLRPLSGPFLFWANLGTFFLELWGLQDGVFARIMTERQAALLLALVAATARAQACGPLALFGLLLAYAAAFAPRLSAAGSWEGRLEFLLLPWRLGAFSLVMTSAAGLGAALHGRWPRLLEGRCAQGFFRNPSSAWVHWPAAILASVAAFRHGLETGYRRAPEQLPATYLAAATFAAVGFFQAEASFFAAAAVLLGVGNIHAVRLYLGPALRAAGLMENHLLCLGAAVTVVQASLARLLARREEALVFWNRLLLGWSGFILTLLSATYFIQPNLEVMTNERFLLSGLMAYLAGLQFQRAARRPDPGEAPFTGLWEGLYHFGLTTALWCLALLIPWFRDPNAAFPALGLPVLYFYARAELAFHHEAGAVARYRNTAAALSFFMLTLYAFRSAFQMMLFPDAPLGSDHYHFNAPFVLILASVMLRLHGLGGTSWLAFYGGLGMMVGGYFTLTRLPGMSPFSDPIPSAWCAVSLGHFWLLACSRQSPLKTFLQGWAGIAEPQWFSLRSSWGICLAVATQFSLSWGLVHCGNPPDSYMAAPLLAGGASLLAHQGAIRRSSAFYLWAGFEAALALHADFFVPSFLPRSEVLWAILLLWSGFLLVSGLRPRLLSAEGMGPLAFGFGMMSMAHIVFYHHPDSSTGLWAFGCAALVAALTPRASREPASAEERLAAALPLAAPVWLAYFSQTAYPRTALTVAATLFLTGCFARWYQARLAAGYAARPRDPARLFDQTLSLLAVEGAAVNSALLYAVFAITAGVQVLYYGKAHDPADFGLMLALYGFSAFAWYQEGRFRKTMPPYFLLQFCVLGFFAVIRRQLMLTWGVWNYEYDVWASLLVSFSLAGAKQVLPLQPRETRIPLLGTLLCMPVAVMIWVLIHGLGTNAVLLVVGLYSLMFAYMGKDDRESPYHLVAVGGFVAFILIVFWTKLELRVIQAYVIPVGLGVLTLLQLFREKIPAGLRNEIRAVTLLCMLGSAGYYALADERYPMAFHMTFLVLSVLAMGLGSFLRIRLYLLLGFGGLLTDLASIVYKALVLMDRSARMTLIGGQVLAFGAALIFGAIYYKTHQEEITERLERWRGRLAAWE